jgi:HPr kinase/phosphorylase
MGEMRSLVHGTAVALGDRVVLLRGPSGAGKSDLALRLLGVSPEILTGIGLSAKVPRLISDDQVWLERKGKHIVASAPEAILGRIEVRGVGIFHVPATPSARVRLIIDLVPAPDVPRLPLEELTDDLLGLQIPVLKLHPFEPSAPLKVALALFGRPDWS